MKIRVLTGISIVIITWLTLSDLKVFRYAIDCINGLNHPTAFEASILRLCLGNLAFKLIGITMAVIGLFQLLRKTVHLNLNLKLKILFIYTVIALILTLPIYHLHAGFGGPRIHGHSFWSGSHHLH